MSNETEAGSAAKNFRVAVKPSGTIPDAVGRRTNSPKPEPFSVTNDADCLGPGPGHWEPRHRRYPHASSALPLRASVRHARSIQAACSDNRVARESNCRLSIDGGFFPFPVSGDPHVSVAWLRRHLLAKRRLGSARPDDPVGFML